MIVKVIKNLKNKMEKMQESINKDLEELKNQQTETNNTIIEIKNTLEGINSRISEAKERISELEDKMVEITSEKQNKVKRMKLNHYLTPYTKTNSKRIEDLNIRAKTIKLLGENISSKLLDSGLRDDVLDLIWKVKATKAKTNK